MLFLVESMDHAFSAFQEKAAFQGWNKMREVNLLLCPGCMRKLPEGQSICPSCGWDLSARYNPEETLPEGTVLFRKYLIGRVIGQGGFGITYLGYDLDLAIKVAIKEYYPIGYCKRSSRSYNVMTTKTDGETGFFSKGCEAFLEEARTLAQFNSPYIVHVRDFFREHETAYIVMDFVEGVTLKDEIKRCGKLPADRVLTLMGPLIRQLGKLHQKNIIHRDIKPDNLMIVRDGDEERLVLLDFGAARYFASDHTKTMTGVVTHGFAPLEQYSQRSRQGPYTDVYALCATIYNAITSVIPPPATERSADDLSIEPFSAFGVTVPEYVEAAIMHGLELKREKRTQTMIQLQEELKGPSSHEMIERLLKRGYFQQAEFEILKMEKTIPDRVDYSLCLYRLCCKYETAEIRQLAKKVPDLQKESLFILAKKNARTQEEVNLINQLISLQNEEKKKAEKKKQETEHKKGEDGRELDAEQNEQEHARGLEKERSKQQLDQKEKQNGSTPVPNYSSVGEKITHHKKFIIIFSLAIILILSIWGIIAELMKDKDAPPNPKSNVGSYVTFGHYPQTKEGNDNTPIEWLVLAREGKKVLLLSRYGLDAQPYNKEYASATWEECTLRTWLNDTFLHRAFTADEQAGVLLTNVDNSSNQGYRRWNTNGGKNTKDNIFLLSYAEANKYLGVTWKDRNNMKSRCSPTAYALEVGARTSDGNQTVDGAAAGRWWLRSPGSGQNGAADVISDGSLGRSNVSTDSGCVRPALWINLESDIF